MNVDICEYMNTYKYEYVFASYVHWKDVEINQFQWVSLGYTIWLENNVLHKKKPEILREMTESKSGTEDIQDETEAPCHTDIRKVLKDY